MNCPVNSVFILVIVLQSFLLVTSSPQFERLMGSLGQAEKSQGTGGTGSSIRSEQLDKLLNQTAAIGLPGDGQVTNLVQTLNKVITNLPIVEGIVGQLIGILDEVLGPLTKVLGAEGALSILGGGGVSGLAGASGSAGASGGLGGLGRLASGLGGLGGLLG